MTADSKNIDKLIARYISGEASGEEREWLEHWIIESESNKKYFNDIRLIDIKVAASRKIVKVDINKAWEHVRHQMKYPTPGKSAAITQSQVRIIRFMKAAAVLIIVLGLSFLLYKIYLSSSVKTETFIVESNDSTLNYMLDDSTLVILSRNSDIKYTSRYGIKQREVSITGEVFFNRHEFRLKVTDSFE